MQKRLKKLVGLTKAEFDEFITTGEIQVSRAGLIPTYKPGDELALTSVLLSAIRLIKEFGKMILSAARIPSGGKIYVFTEVVFSECPESRIDGLAIIVRGGKINNAIIFEMKNANNEIQKEQIEKYIKLAKLYSIPNIITVSNQFVADPRQSPVQLRCPKDISLYHFSWSYLLTVAHILLMDNDTNIEDIDQVELMREVVFYFENNKSGICGFNQMGPGWKELVENVNMGKTIRPNDEFLGDAIVSWRQEEKDMALILSRKLGIFVNVRIKGDLRTRLREDVENVIKIKELGSILSIKGAVSDISIKALLEKRTIEMGVVLPPPQNKKTKSQMTWIRNQLANCKKKNEEEFSSLINELFLEIVFKNTSKVERISVWDIDAIRSEIPGREVKAFRILFVKDFGKNFASRIKIIEIIEKMIIDYYKYIVQYLVKWEEPAPQIKEPKEQTINVVDINANESPEENEVSTPVTMETLGSDTGEGGSDIEPDSRAEA